MCITISNLDDRVGYLNATSNEDQRDPIREVIEQARIDLNRDMLKAQLFDELLTRFIVNHQHYSGSKDCELIERCRALQDGGGQ